MKKILMPIAALLLVSACSDAVAPGARRPVTVQFGGGQPLRPATMMSAASVTATHGSNTLVVDTVKMTLEDIDLERAEQSVDCSTTADASQHADCSDYFPGPYLVRLNLDGGLSGPLTLEAQAGTYDTVSFDISVPDGGDPAQRAYLAANPDMQGVSIRIIGRYNGAPFSFALDLTGDQDIPIQPPLEVSGGLPGTLGIAVNFDVASWFRRADGSLIDPRTICSADSGCADRSRVEQNIEASIESYTKR